MRDKHTKSNINFIDFTISIRLLSIDTPINSKAIKL